MLEALAATPDGLGIRDIFRRTGIDKSVVSRLLTQLEALSMATKDEVQGPVRHPPAAGRRCLALGGFHQDGDLRGVAPRPVRAEEQRFTRCCAGSAAVRAGVRFALRAYICRLVPPGSLVGVPAWRRGQDAKRRCELRWICLEMAGSIGDMLGIRDWRTVHTS